jgi:hypothetical protein
VDHVINVATGLKVNLPESIRLDVEYEPAAEVYDLTFLHVSYAFQTLLVHKF